MKKSIAKVLSTICTAAMIFGVFSTAVFADGEITLDQAYITSHGNKMPVEAGNYKLTENIAVSAGANVETQGAKINIDLNGYTINYTGTESMYVLGKVLGTGTMTSTEQSPVDTNNFVTGVELTIDGDGTITGGDVEGTGSTDYWINGTGVGTNINRGGCILILYGCKATLESGTITGFEAGDEGGAICASNGSEFIMNGGTITNCSAGKGGAISAQGSSAAKYTDTDLVSSIHSIVTINGGLITGNTASEGGGIRSQRAIIRLYGGTITGNSATETGGGLSIIGKSNNWTSNNGIKGSPKIYDNTCKEKLNSGNANLYFVDNNPFILDGTLESDAVIHFGGKATTQNFFKPNGNGYLLSSLIPDHQGYLPYFTGTYIKISDKPVIMSYAVSISGEILLVVKVYPHNYADSLSVNASYSYDKNGQTKNLSKTVDTKVASGSNFNFYIPVESACMTSGITVSVNYDGNKTVSGSTLTIEEYAKQIINNKSAKQKDKDIAQALLIFGGYSQKQLKINTSALPTVANIDFSNPANYGLVAPDTDYAPTSDPNGAYAGAKLSLLSQTEIQLYFKKSVLGDTAPEMTVNYGSTSVTAPVSENGSYWVYTINGASGNGINATAYDSTFTYSVGDVTGTYSVKTFLEIVMKKNNNESMVNLVQAYYNFATICKQG